VRATAISSRYTGSCEPTECWQRNCRAHSDRSQPNRFRASPDSKADAALTPAVSVIALAYSPAAGAAAFPYRDCGLAVVLVLLGVGGGGLLAARLETGAERSSGRNGFRSGSGALAPPQLVGLASNTARRGGLVPYALELRDSGAESASPAWFPSVGRDGAALGTSLGLALEAGQTRGQR
jgi:hypothetical protein